MSTEPLILISWKVRIGPLSGWAALVSNIDLPLLTGWQASPAPGPHCPLQHLGHVSGVREPVRTLRAGQPQGNHESYCWEGKRENS